MESGGTAGPLGTTLPPRVDRERLAIEHLEGYQMHVHGVDQARSVHELQISVEPSCGYSWMSENPRPLMVHFW